MLRSSSRSLFSMTDCMFGLLSPSSVVCLWACLGSRPIRWPCSEVAVQGPASGPSASPQGRHLFKLCKQSRRGPAGRLATRPLEAGSCSPDAQSEKTTHLTRLVRQRFPNDDSSFTSLPIVLSHADLRLSPPAKIVRHELVRYDHYQGIGGVNPDKWSKTPKISTLGERFGQREEYRPGRWCATSTSVSCFASQGAARPS